MSASRILQNLLATYGPLTALVPPANIHLGTVGQTDPLPAIGITEISRNELRTVARNQQQSLVTSRVQVTVFSKSYIDQKSIIRASKLGPGIHRGLVAGYQVLAVLRDIVGPDLSNEDAGICQQSRDFIVKYVEDN